MKKGSKRKLYYNRIKSREWDNEFTVRNDYAFKIVFGSEESKEILPEFLSLVTNMDPSMFAEISIENPALMPEYTKKKMGILDLKLTLKTGQKINIELQNYWSSHYPKRSLYYWAKLYTENIGSGDKYEKLQKCISIHILNDNFPLSNKTHSIYRIMEAEEHKVLDNVLEIHFLDLTKVENDNNLGLLKNWLVFIRTNDRKEREKMAKTSAALERANELMERFYSDPEARRQYEAARKLEMDQWMFEEEFKRRGMERGMKEGMEKGMEQGMKEGMQKGMREGMEKGMKEGIKEGIKEGMKEEKRVTAQRMKHENLPIDIIVRCTGLPEKEILEL